MSKPKFDTSLFTQKGAGQKATPASVLPSQSELGSAQPREPFPFQSEQISLSEIKPNPDQPRKTFDEEALKELADSIAEVGLIQPIVVVRRSEFYTIIAGERRYQAHVLLGLSTISCVVRPADEKEQQELLLALAENVQREDLRPIEEARAIKNAMTVNSLSQVKMAKQLGKSRRYVQDLLGIIERLDPDMLLRAQEAELPKMTLFELAALKDLATRRALFERAIKDPKGSWSAVREEKARREQARRPQTFRKRTTFDDLPGSVTISIPKKPAAVKPAEVLLYLQKAVDDIEHEQESERGAELPQGA